MLVKFKDPSNPSNSYDILDMCFVRTNKNCSKPEEPLCYTYKLSQMLCLLWIEAKIDLWD